MARRCHSRCISNANRKETIATSAVWAFPVNLTAQETESLDRCNPLQNVDGQKGDVVLLGRSGGLPAAGSRFDCSGRFGGRCSHFAG